MVMIPSIKSFGIKVLLIDDQPIVAEAIRRMLEIEKDIEFRYCQDATKALKIAEEYSPTVILQDLVMPEMDGLDLLQSFRSNTFTRDVPLIVLSSKEDPIVKADAFALGANDYLVKLPDKIELIARIRYHSSAFIRLLERNVAYEQLAESQRLLHGELADAATYVRELLPKPLTGRISTKWEFIPSALLGGDAFGYYWLDEDFFVFYLLDVCGHGVRAALLSITVMNVLQARTLQNANFYEPASVLKELNEHFPMEKNNEMYFTMWYGIYNSSTQTLCYADAGHPPALLAQKSGQLMQLKTGGMVIGAIKEVIYPQASVKVASGDKLYVYSDGIYEIAKPDGTMLQIDDFVQYLTNNKAAQLSDIIDYSKKLNGEKPFSDDLSIMEINF